ncbi:MAG: response regulator, partial [Melioribacteraceae bacterium]|nr:response regulator [Melioribacteraceae bacterium]
MEKKKKILIVDDEKIVRESFYHWFIEDNYLVDTAEDGESALNKYTKEKYDLLLVDMKMPGMSGLDLLSKIKAIDKEAIIILITAFSSVPTAITALKNGAYDYVTKPVDPDELAHLVKRALEQRDLKIENVQLKENIDEIIRPDNLIGESFQIKKIYELVHSVSHT